MALDINILRMRHVLRICPQLKNPKPMCMAKPKYSVFQKINNWIDAFKILPHSLKIP